MADGRHQMYLRGVLGLPESISACLFDLDGVLTSTAVVHRRAWKQTFDEFLAERYGDGYEPFSDADYATHVDGRPRYDGVREFLTSRDIKLPEGEADDPPTADTICGVGNRKNELVLAAIERDGVDPYPGSVSYLRGVRDAGLSIAVVTSSANATAILQVTGLEEFVHAQVDGVRIPREGLAGKPAPDSFLTAAHDLAVEPSASAVFEDALAGVQAGRAGGFGYVVGVDREDQADALYENGADVVVSDLSELFDREPTR